MKLSPWQKIVRAGKRGTGLKLSFDEVQSLNMDDAICTRAANDELNQNHSEFGGDTPVYPSIPVSRQRDLQ